MSALTRSSVPWSPSLSKWDRDCQWSTHLERILAGENRALAARFGADKPLPRRVEDAGGGRKISWLSILDVDCPICGAGKDKHCENVP